ncbi:MAG TPA: HlyD family efflux transporter periplasmic adaptor subunit [Candidatus Sulfotelmatobacter sp.]|jgi:multidrug resistance efflux pump|nr:HlyD family efflux transporter periplasmic adaptor subunit [Candidatus Sulfotelmatobacter sp.]
MKKTISRFKNKKFLKGFGIILGILLLIGVFIFYEKVANRIFIDSSLIQAPLITISPSGNGKVQEMDVTEGQHVQKGDQLAIVGSEALRSDTDGMIVTSQNITGSTVGPQTQLIQMIRPVDFRVAGTIDENKGLDSIKLGQVVSFTIDAFPNKTYWGFVDEVSPTAKTAQLSFSISSERPTQQFVIYARFDSARYPEIKNGMSAKMTIYTKTN